MDDLLVRIGWSRAQLSRRLEVSEKTVSRWQYNTPTVVILYLELVAKGMNV